MNFSSLKNIPPMYLYLVSMISFVLANITREKSIELYYVLVLIGLLSFIFGLVKKVKTK